VEGSIWERLSVIPEGMFRIKRNIKSMDLDYLQALCLFSKPVYVMHLNPLSNQKNPITP